MIIQVRKAGKVVGSNHVMTFVIHRWWEVWEPNAAFARFVVSAPLGVIDRQFVEVRTFTHGKLAALRPRVGVEEEVEVFAAVDGVEDKVHGEPESYGAFGSSVESSIPDQVQ